MSRENSGCNFDILTGGAKGHTQKSKLESHAVQLSLNAIGIGTLGGVPSAVLAGAKSTKSANEYKSYMHMHVRSKLETHEKYSEPITTSQEIGWKPWVPKPPQHGLKSCEETRIAEGQILGPRHP